MSEQLLIRRLRNGDPEALDDLVDEYRRPLFAFIMRMVGDQTAAEDIFQDTWIKVIRSVHKFRGEAKLSTWLFQVALNQVRDALRKKGRHHHVPLDEAIEVPSRDGVDVDRILRAEEVKRMVAKLPVKMREVVVLKFYHDLRTRK